MLSTFDGQATKQIISQRKNSCVTPVFRLGISSTKFNNASRSPNLCLFDYIGRFTIAGPAKGTDLNLISDRH